MRKLWMLLWLSMSVPAWATTYTIAAGSSVSSMQATLNAAGASAGNVVMFSAGAYTLTSTLSLPCANGTVYTGPNVGVVTQSNLPTAVLSNTVPTNYALSTGNNGTGFTGTQGCTIQYLRFSGTQGGLLVYYPASGITIEHNAFDNNNPPAGGASSEPNIWLDGQNAGFTAATGIQHITVIWNTFFNNCAAIRASAYPDSGGRCASTWVNAYNNYLVWSNNTVNLTEEGLKFSQQSASGVTSANADVENNNMQGNSRIMIETQQDTNGAAIFSHNAFYQPYNPSNNTFELSMPEWTASIAPTHTASDNVFIGNVPVTVTGDIGHYGIGLELWGAGSVATYNLFQGANGAETCPAGGWCSGWQICLGGSFTNGTIANNYFSGTDQWAGAVNNMSNALTYEESASSSNAGLVTSGNTVVENSTTLATVAPAIAEVSNGSGATVTLSDSDTHHRLSIFYTTDGTTPGIFAPGRSAGSSQVYAGPFTVAAGATVRAIAAWGQGANQGIVFPSFGYVPSSVASLVIGASGQTLVSVSVRSKGNVSSVSPGGTVQFVAYAKYSDGSTSELPDAHGNAVTLWNTSNHKVAKISTGGHATTMNAGTVTVQAVVGKLSATPWTLIVQASPTAQSTADVQAAARVDTAAQGQTDTAARTQTDTAAQAQANGAQANGAQANGAQPNAGQVAPAQAGGGPGGAGQNSLLAAGPMPQPPGAPLPDKFQGPFWQLVNPAGGAASISGGHLFLGVPGGSTHDLLQPSNQAVRVVQPIGNQDFDVSIKIDSPMVATDGNTSQGLMVQSDSQNFVTFALTTDGTKVGLTARILSGGTATTVLEDRDFSQYQNPMYLRLSKSGSAFVAFYSVDGASWTQAASFNYAKASAWVGPFAGNSSDTPSGAVPVVMSVNWFDAQQ